MKFTGCLDSDTDFVVAGAGGRGSPLAARPGSAPLGIAGPGSSKNDLAAGWRWGVWGRAPPGASEHGGIEIHGWVCKNNKN